MAAVRRGSGDESLVDVTFSLKRRVDSFDSVDSFDVISLGDCGEAAASLHDERDDGEWEDVPESPERVPVDADDEQVEIVLHEAIVIRQFDGAPLPPVVSVVPATASTLPPRRPSPREALREFYLARAMRSKEMSQRYRAFEPVLVPSRAIPPLCAPERYPVEVVERVTRDRNTREAARALREFYAQRAIEKQQRAAMHRANEVLVLNAQVGSSTLRATCHQHLRSARAPRQRPLSGAHHALSA